MSATEPRRRSHASTTTTTSKSDAGEPDTNGNRNNTNGAVNPEQMENSDDDIEAMFAPINAPPAEDDRLYRLHTTTSRPVERSWSLNDGYSCHTLDEEVAEKVPLPGERTEEDAFTVGWEENDPLCPRNFNTFRRWIIVIICSTGSLCV